MDIDQAIEDFIAAGAKLGIPEPALPTDRSALDQLEAELAPLRLPAAIRRFWERVDTMTLRALAPMPAADPDFALWTWQQSRDEFADLQPLALLTIGSESHGCTSIELEQDGFEGGAIFEWYVDDGDFTRKFNDLQGWLQFQTDALGAEGLYESRTDGLGRTVWVPTDRAYAAYDLLVAPAHPFYGDETLIERDIMEWPEHWRALVGVTEESVRCRGATHSIAELMSTDPGIAVAATLVATVASLASSGAGCNVLADDGTGLLMIHCPPKASALGPVISETFEFDVVVPEAERIAAVDPETVAGGPDEKFLARYEQPIGAVATAIRRT